MVWPTHGCTGRRAAHTGVRPKGYMVVHMPKAIKPAEPRLGCAHHVHILWYLDPFTYKFRLVTHPCIICPPWPTTGSYNCPGNHPSDPNPFLSPEVTLVLPSGHVKRNEPIVDFSLPYLQYKKCGGESNADV